MTVIFKEITIEPVMPVSGGSHESQKKTPKESSCRLFIMQAP